MTSLFKVKPIAVLLASLLAGGSVVLTGCGGGGGSDEPAPAPAKPDISKWMGDAAKLEAPSKRADALLGTTNGKSAADENKGPMTLEQKLQQLTGANQEILVDMPQCFGARHVTGIIDLAIPTLRITNGPVGIGQNDCVDPSVKATAKTGWEALGHWTSAKATALPSGMSVAASFDPAIAYKFGDVIGKEANALALHVFEAPGVNMARLSVLGRNFEYFGEDPFLSGSMSVAEGSAVQANGVIAMPKHFVGNEQETNRMTINEIIDDQVLNEIYLLPFEMSVKETAGYGAKDAKGPGSIMCAYNYVNGEQSCQNKAMLTDKLRTEWGFTGYVQSDFFALKTTVKTMKSGMDHEMPTPAYWGPQPYKKHIFTQQPIPEADGPGMLGALASGALTMADINQALHRRYTQMFRFGIFDAHFDKATQKQVLEQKYARGDAKWDDFFKIGKQAAREIGVNSAVLLQNPNNTLPFAKTPGMKVAVIGKKSQVYAKFAVVGGIIDASVIPSSGKPAGEPLYGFGGSSDVVPHLPPVRPLDGIKAALEGKNAAVDLILVEDDNSNIAEATAKAAAADAVILMAGTVTEEGADRVAFADKTGLSLQQIGDNLDWYTIKPSTLTTVDGSNGNKAGNSNTVAMIKAIMGATSTTGKAMNAKTALVLKDNAGVAMDADLVGGGATAPAILEVWFPGQEDGNIVADLVFGDRNPSGKLPVTFPLKGQSFMESIAGDAVSYPGMPKTIAGTDATGEVEYKEKLNIGYRWYDANNKKVAFPFGHGLSYTSFEVSGKSASYAGGKLIVKATVKNTGARDGAEVVQVYVNVPAGSGLAQPPKRLVGFQKVALKAGTSQEVTITIDRAASNHPFSVWDKAQKKFVEPSGNYKVYVGTSSRDASFTSETSSFNL